MFEKQASPPRETMFQQETNLHSTMLTSAQFSPQRTFAEPGGLPSLVKCLRILPNGASAGPSRAEFQGHLQMGLSGRAIPSAGVSMVASPRGRAGRISGGCGVDFRVPEQSPCRTIKVLVSALEEVQWPLFRDDKLMPMLDATDAVGPAIRGM